ncbi:MAG TPA: hypothetical protein DCR98_16105, partial [Cobetia sp.]|nr:hypothetical protein [Cobetia sp.]
KGGKKKKKSKGKKKATTTKKVDVLQFGKISKGNFSLDYRFPVSPIQAFGVFLSAFSFLSEMIRSGVRVFRYQPGFLHQKVMLMDSHTATIGTVNLDNRSFRLNFEITAFVPDHQFASEVEAMLEEDFRHCREISCEELDARPMWRKLVSRAAYLLAPIQ